MPATTPLGYPYPVGTDRVADGDDAIHELAETVDTQLGVSAAGKTSLTISAAITGSVSVTFPAGRFTAPPIVSATSANGTYFAAVGNPTAAGVTLYGRQYEAVSGTVTFDIHWVARSAG